MGDCRRRFFSALAVAAWSMLLPPSLADAQQAAPPSAGVEKEREPELASRGQRNLAHPIKYGDWQKFCFKSPGTRTVCRATITGTWDTGQTAVRADLIEREGEDKARLQLFLPVGMYLKPGVKLTVDQRKPHQIPYVSCMTNTCIAGNVADPQLIREMEKGEKLVLEVVDFSLQTVSTTLPLSQFASIRKGLSVQTYRQDIDE